MIAHIAPHRRMEVDFFFLSWSQAREVNCRLVLLAFFSDYRRIERIIALNCARYSLLNVRFAVGQVFIEVRSIFSKDFIAKLARVLVLEISFNGKKRVLFW